MGLALFLQPAEDHQTLPFSSSLPLLSAFGLLHGAHELYIAWHLAHPGLLSPSPWLAGVLLYGSYLPLLEFGRRLYAQAGGFRLTPWRLYPGVLLVTALFMFRLPEPAVGLGRAARYFVGLPGAVLTGRCLFRFCRLCDAGEKTAALCSYKRLAGMGFLAYAFFAGMVVEPRPGVPGLPISSEIFRQFTGLPVELFRAACAVLIAYCLIHVARLSNLRLWQREREMIQSLEQSHAHLEAEVDARTVTLKQINQTLAAEIEQRRKAQESLAQALEELTDAKHKQEQLLILAENERRRLCTLLSAMNIGILFEDRNGRVEFVNPAFLRLWAIPDTVDISQMPAKQVLDHSTHRFARPDLASKHVLQVLDANEISERFEIDLYDGRVLTQLSFPVTNDDGTILGRLWLYEDITHERQTAQQLLYLAEHDPLTGLYNRHRFQKQLEQMFCTARRSSIRFALFYFDLDEFKYINDTFDHSAGDTVLTRVANEVGKVVRACEVFARLGGDEFAVLSLLGEQEAPDALCQRIITAVSSIPLRLRGTNIRLTTSMGIAIYPEHGETPEDLVAHADSAMYRAKERGKNTWVVYDPINDVSKTALKRMTLGRLIERALKEDGFELHYQGVYCTDGSLCHLEALVRLQDPEHPEHLIMPGQFIPSAESSGQIIEIDRWVLRRSVETLARNPQIPAIAVNISGKSFDVPLLPGFIGGLLEEFKATPGRLLIELTETEAVSDLEDAQRFIEAIRHLGCQVCMDDFGSGFSTFVYLKYLDVDLLKIDGLFIKDLANNRQNQTFVRAMVDIARGMEKSIVAEFVEDRATMDKLIELGVDLLQGYYFGRPAADFRPLLAAGPCGQPSA